jgi:hypothetical protein
MPLEVSLQRARRFVALELVVSCTHARKSEEASKLQALGASLFAFLKRTVVNWNPLFCGDLVSAERRKHRVITEYRLYSEGNAEID